MNVLPFGAHEIIFKSKKKKKEKKLLLI